MLPDSKTTTNRHSRREFLQSAAAGAAGAAFPFAHAEEKHGNKDFSFALLGDLHFDKLQHHDASWVKEKHQGDWSQIENYSRISHDVTPSLLRTVRETLAKPGSRAAFVLQVGDLVEGLCGNVELARKQNEEAIAFVREALPSTPFLFAKGNHDVTGPGAEDAFREVLSPFLATEAKSFGSVIDKAHACYSLRHDDAEFFFFDAYAKESLDWLAAALPKRTARHCFVIVHPPVVPYGARATWNIFNKDSEKAKRDKILALLGKQEAIVLGGHIHKFSTLQRRTEGSGRFAQIAVSSVVSSAQMTAKDVLGESDYNGDQIRVEPRHSPETEKERRAVYEQEAPMVNHFAYADLPGFAMVHVRGDGVTLEMFAGGEAKLWRTVDVSELLKA